MIEADLVFIHLSDIHFRRGMAGDVHDEDRVLRHELGLDLRRLRARFPRLDGVLVSGDIAYGGKSEEYLYARSWLDSVLEQLECGPECLLVTPGNHDVDRTVLGLDEEIGEVQERIRIAGSVDESSGCLAEALRLEGDGARLCEPLAAYNDFARDFDCDVSRNAPYWERDFLLPDNTVFRLRGITTTFLSGPNDHEHTSKMLYGGAQRSILREERIRHAIIGHHPPSWSIDGEQAEQAFSTLTYLQIFGHKHEQWLTNVGGGVRLIAGAVHPERLERRWLPRFSAISIRAIDEHRLALRVYPRRWSSEEIAFIGDFNSRGEDYRDLVAEVPPTH